MSFVKEAYDNGWKMVIQPKKHTHNIYFQTSMPDFPKNVEIIEFKVKNNDGSNISSLIIKNKNNLGKIKNSIFYFHGNGGSKLEAISFAEIISKNENIAVITFDFLGCGNSDKGYLTYGIKQALDAQLVLRQSHKYIDYQKLCIWGRSMGALTAIVFAQKNHKIISNLILDSCFSSLKSIIMKVIRLKTHLPSPLDTMLFYFLQQKINSKLFFDLFEINYGVMIGNIPKHIPILFISSINDSVVSKQQVLAMYHSSKSMQRRTLQIQQEHQEERSIQVFKTCVQWLLKSQEANVPKRNNKLTLSHKNFDVQFEKNPITIFC